MTKKNLNILLVVLSILFFSISSFSQTPEFIQELKGESDYIFEGRIVNSIGKWSTDKTMIYTEHEIYITKIFKGNITNNKQKVITVGGIANREFAFLNTTLELSQGDEGLFFTKEKDCSQVTGFDRQNNNHFANKKGSFIPKKFNDYIDGTLGFGAKYKKEKYEDIIEIVGNLTNEFAYEGYFAVPESFDCGDDGFEAHANVSFENVTISSDLQNLEFDVMIQSFPDNVNLGRCEYTLQFPENIFGSNLIQNNLISITKGDIIDSDDYIMNVIDLESNTMKIDIDLINGFNTPYSLNGGIEKLIHCSFSVSNPSLLLSLSGSDFELDGNMWYECKGRLEPFDRINIDNSTKEILPNTSNVVGVNYNLQKFHYRIAGGGQFKLLSFDVYASSTEPTIYNSGNMYIDYSNLAIQESNANAGATITLDDNLTPLISIEQYTATIEDEDNNTLRVRINPPTGATPYFQLNEVPIKLFSVTLLVLDCDEEANLVWNNLTNNNGNTYLDGNDEFQFAPITTSGELESKICGCNQQNPEIKITSFSHDLVRAGTGEILKIFGEDFGNVIINGNSYIEVDNADHDPVDRTEIRVDDIIDWNNNEITFIVPSTTIGKTEAPMESGEVKIFGECGSSDGETMNVEYSVLNVRSSEKAYRLALEKQGSDGIEFTLSNNVGTLESSLVTNAISTWCNTTNITWSLKPETTTSTAVDPNDGLNLVVEVNPSNSNLINAGTAAGVIVYGTIIPNGPNYTTSCTNTVSTL